MTLWIIFAVLLAAVLVAVLWPLLRPRAVPANRADYDIEVYLDQLRELERDASRELIDEVQAAAAKLEIERRLLAASRTADSAAGGDTSAVRRPMAAAAIAVAIAVATLALYVNLGSPGLPNQPFAQRAPEPSESPQIVEARSRLAAVEGRLSAELENPDVWRDLGRLRLVVGDGTGAVEALAQAMTLSGGRADIASVYGEALTFAADGLVVPQAQQLFQKVLSENASEPRARYFMALARYQAGLREEALEQWSALASDAPPGAPWLAAVSDRIRRTADEVGADVANYLPAPPGPTEEDITAAQNLSAEQQQEMIRGMVGRLASRLVSEPNDIEGWRRLGQSYDVLDQPTHAAEAYAKALSLEPNHPETLLRAGLAAARAKENATALVYFERLRSFVAEDSDAYRTVSEAIERLTPSKPAD
ncbi:MAG: c-type cytochrome biogenesis protein CcmI [Alphaproteobacteria bacterium]|nr:c-type cytochrome biogenesis protein CcmI [Alphaproteobacteria bacterium]